MLGRSSPSALTPGKPPPDSRTALAISFAVSSGPAQVDVERDERHAGRPRSRRRPSDRAATARSRAGSRRHRFGLQLHRPAAPVERRAAPGRCVEEHGQPERPDPLAERARHGSRGLEIAVEAARSARRLPPRSGGARPRGARRSIRFACHLHARDERLDQLVALSRASVKTDRLWSGSAWTSSSRARAPSASPIASIVAGSRPSEKFGTDSSTPGIYAGHVRSRCVSLEPWRTGTSLAITRPSGGCSASCARTRAPSSSRSSWRWSRRQGRSRSRG